MTTGVSEMAFVPTMDEVAADLTKRSHAALVARRNSGQTFFYVDGGWVFCKRAGGNVDRLCRVEDFRAADYPEDDSPG